MFPATAHIDPPLTDFGIKQARYTGEFLKKHFAENGLKFDKIIIECSPFLRCMQTASYLGHALGVTEIGINYKASDIQTGYKFAKDPFPELEYVMAGFDYQ